MRVDLRRTFDIIVGAISRAAEIVFAVERSKNNLTLIADAQTSLSPTTDSDSVGRT